MNGDEILWKFSGRRQNLVSRSLLFVKQLFDGQHEMITVLRMYQINSDGILPTQFFEVSDTMSGEYLAVREFVSEQ